MRRKYLKKRLILNKKQKNKFSGFYATAEINEFWFLDMVMRDILKEEKKLNTSIYWLNKIIKKPDKEKQESFDVKAIKQNATPQKILNISPVKEIGNKEWYLCPLHNEKTPSFCWNKDDKYYKCFGCGEGGDIINLYMKINNCNFRQACLDLQYVI